MRLCFRKCPLDGSEPAESDGDEDGQSPLGPFADSEGYHHVSVPTGSHQSARCKQGSHRSPKVLNVLEFDFSIRVPSNVLEFHWMFLNVLE